MADHSAFPPTAAAGRPDRRDRRRIGRGLGALGTLVLLLGAGPADPLFRLVPPQSSLILAVEDLRTGARQVEASSLGEGLKQLPLVASWLGSDRFKRFQRASDHVEVGLGMPIRTVLNEVLGDAVVLALQAGADGTVDRSSGLVLIKPRQPKLLAKFMDARNLAQSKRGSLAQVESRRHGATAYTSRLFRPGAAPSNHYVFLDDGTFAWSNSEATIRDVIDRRAGVQVGWDAAPTFARLRSGLPRASLVSLFVAPNVLTQVVTTPRPAATRTEHYVRKVATTYLGAVEGAGFALEWRDGLILHSHELVDPRRLPPWMASWMGRPSHPVPVEGNLTPATFGVVAARFDCAEALRIARLLVEPEERVAWDAAEQAAQGLALGQNLDDLLARVEPHVFLTLEPRSGPEARGWLAVVGGVAWLNAREAAVSPWVAVDNAFRTAMAMVAVRPLRRAAGYQVTTRLIDGRPVTALGPPERTVLAYQSLPDRFVVSNHAEAIGPFTAPPNDATEALPLAVLRARYAADLETYAVFDLPRFAEAVVRSRRLIVRNLAARSNRPPAEVDRDLDQFLALIQLFRAAVGTSNANPDATEVHRTFGLIAR